LVVGNGGGGGHGAGGQTGNSPGVWGGVFVVVVGSMANGTGEKKN